MKQLAIFIQKEFYHVLRDRKTLLILFGMPVVQILLFGFALSNEIKNTKIVILDHAKDLVSQQLIQRIDASQYFDVAFSIDSDDQLEASFLGGNIKAAIVFPSQLSAHMNHLMDAQIQIIADAVDINAANQIKAYLEAIIQQYVNDQQKLSPPEGMRTIVETRMLYNPQLRGAPNFVPGVMAMVLLLVCVMMTAISIVREKETGTMEVLLVSPMQPAFIIIAKAVPYLFLSIINLTAILLLSVYVLDLPIKGSIGLLFFASTLFIMTCLALGILISIQTKTQEVAMFISLVGMMLPTLMLSGFMFPTENMPWILQMISNVVPSKWYYIIVKNVMIKGAGMSAIWHEMLILIAIMMVLFGISVKRFNIRLQE